MHVTFGMALDGAEWSENGASLGQIRVGPAGLLDLFETRLGLGGLRAHPARRIDAYMARLQDVAHQGAWFEASMEADPWSTARQLLAWRDELVEAGWDGRTGSEASPRLASLTLVEGAPGPELSPGPADRLRSVLEFLSDGLHPGIDRVQLADAAGLLPPIWRVVMGRLSTAGVRVEEVDASPAWTGESNLAVIQSEMHGVPRGGIDPTRDDDSLLLLEGHDEWEAAEAMALWLRGGPDPSDVTLICGSDSGILDQALARHGLPIVGRSEASPWRGVLQVLPLVLANAWSPLDVRVLGELLSISSGPVPGWAASRLLRALTREPGVGGGEWTQAMDDIERQKARFLEADGESRPEEEARQFRSRLDELLATRRFPRDPGIPEGELHERCQWVIDTLVPRVRHDRLSAAAVEHAVDMQALAQGKGELPRILVERMLDSVLGVGSPSLHLRPEAAPWRVVRSPAQVIHPAGTVLWWDFSDSFASPATWWSGPERTALEKQGVTLEPSRLRRQREAAGWRRGLLNARERLLLFHSVRRCGEPSSPHPLWDEIRHAAGVRPGSARAGKIEEALRRDCGDLAVEGRWNLAGREMELESVRVVERTEPAAKYRIDPEAIRAPGALSFSRMSTMIGCPMSWTLGTTGLRTSPIRDIPSGARMMGNLCHRVVEDLYSEGRRHWTPDEAEKRAAALFDGLIGSMASELLLEGHSLDRQRYRKAVTEAVGSLVEAINRHGLEVEATEAPLVAARTEGDGNPDPRWPAGCDSFRGRADLLLRDRRGHRFILDLKWSGSSRYKREELEAGEALQLAAYAWMLRSSTGEDESVHSGYFMLAQGELLTPAEASPGDPEDPDDPFAATWLRGVRSWNARWETLTGDGELEATGIAEEQQARVTDTKMDKVRAGLQEDATISGKLYLRPPCSFCDFPALCGRVGSDR